MILNTRPLTGMVLLIIISSTFLMYAFSQGITGRTLKNGNGCECHSTVPSGSVTVMINGPSTMNTGETATFTVAITGGPLTAAGTNIAALSGVLNPGTGLQKLGLELTHTQPRVQSGGSVVFQFSYTAPAAPGSDTIYANGNSVNLNGSNSGDAWNFAANKSITIQTPTNVEDGNLVSGFKLEQNYPNPFNPSTQINYSVEQSVFVHIAVYSAAGEEIATLVNDYKNAGSYSINFDASDLSSGIYFYKMIASDFIETKKMILLR